MTIPRHRAATIDAVPDAIAASRECVERSIADLKAAILAIVAEDQTGRTATNPSPRMSRIAPGGLILVTDDSLGVARAVVADLKALGHPVLRVRHGVGGPDVEGVNLTAAVSVAALLDRSRNRGPLAAIVHLSPLRPDSLPGRTASWDDPDDARALALLAQAGADDLKSSATRGGSCLIVARRAISGASATREDRLSRWVEISARTLAGVRVRGLEMDAGGEPEVLAAELVHEILGTADSNPGPSSGRMPPTQIQPESQAILLGAPDRAAWIHLAAALTDWLEDAPSVRLEDLAYTLHDNQPEFPFRVGLVASSGPDLAARLRQVIAYLAEPSCRSILDLSGAYWIDREKTMATNSSRAKSWVHRLRGMTRSREVPADRIDFPVESLAAWSGRDWMNHLAASRFAHGDRVQVQALIAGRVVRKLDLAGSSTEGAGTLLLSGPSDTARLLRDLLNHLDEILLLRLRIIEGLLAENSPPDRLGG